MATLRTLEPGARDLAAFFLHWLAGLGIQASVTSTRRDSSTQRRLHQCYVKTGCNDCRSRPGTPTCFPAAAPGKSQHDLGLAFDVKLTPDVPASYELAGRIWESLGLTWGGRFRDPIHFDMRRRGR